MINISIGKRIQKARKAAGLSQKELGAKLGVSGSMIGQYENDLRNPKYETIKRIAAALHVDWTDLVPEGEQEQTVIAHIRESLQGTESNDSAQAHSINEKENTHQETSIDLDAISTEDLINTLKVRAADDPSIVSKLNTGFANMPPLSDEQLLKIAETDGIPKEFLLSDHGKARIEEMRKMFATIDQKGFMGFLEFMRYLYFKHGSDSPPEDK